MIRLLLIPATAILFTGCATTQPDCVPEIIVKKETVKVKVPEPLLVIPPYGEKLEDGSTQKDVSKWVVDTEERMYQLERQLQAIKKFNEDEPKIEVIREPKPEAKDGKTK